MNRNLDGVYFRVKRDEKWQNLCFSDLTEEERNEVMNGRDEKWLRSLCNILANTLKILVTSLILHADRRWLH